MRSGAAAEALGTPEEAARNLPEIEILDLLEAEGLKILIRPADGGKKIIGSPAAAARAMSASTPPRRSGG